MLIYLHLSVFVPMIMCQNDKDYSFIKAIEDRIYVGGKNSLSYYKWNKKQLIRKVHKTYEWPKGIMNGSDIGYAHNFSRWPKEITNLPTSMAFDNCLNWKQEHPNSSVRHVSYDFQHLQYHTPSGDWLTMNFTCMNSFIKGVEHLDNETLWVCGTFGAFPRAFSVNKTTLEFIKFVDVNVMSCARYVDEPMATFRDKSTNDLYVASGWGLYRPDKRNPDVPDNNSTMLYADWRLYRNLFTLPSAMAWVLSSDVNFINVVKETNDHLYFFGHEINNQYGLNNQEDRNAWQSFMLRICKRDLGYKYVPTEISSYLYEAVNKRYYRIEKGAYVLSLVHKEMTFNKSWYQDTVHLPTTHFVSPQKINFGCYVGKRPRSISDNHFWGETNVIYLNKLADVVFNPNRRIKFKTRDNDTFYGCTNESHSQIPLIGLFNRPGIKGTALPSAGALCQLQINENIFQEVGSQKYFYHNYNTLDSKNAFEEIMALSATYYSNFYSRSLHRINGFALSPYWNQGVLMGNIKDRISFNDSFGKCQKNAPSSQMTLDKFLQAQNLSNTAWPNELPNRLTSITSSICQFAAAELYSFNATFVVPGEDFKKIIILKENFTNYHMQKLSNESDTKRNERLRTSPLILLLIISNSGMMYRVSICDFDSAMANHGEDKTSNEWYNWCIFRHTDQPYLYRQYAPMERREWGESYQYRASSLLSVKRIVSESDSSTFPRNRDPQFHIVKDVLHQGNQLLVLTSNNIYPVDTDIQCGSYTKCIDCASDPLCMWKVSSNRCIRFDVTFEDHFFVQDVLDRGFKCAKHMKTNMQVLLPEKFMMFNCTNSGFWRGPVFWKIKNRKLDTYLYNHVMVNDDQNIMTIFNYNMELYGSNVSCYGLKDDEDKLFNGLEYEWSISSSEIVLNEFIIEKLNTSSGANSWKYVGIVSIFVIVSILTWILWHKSIKNVLNHILKEYSNLSKHSKEKNEQNSWHPNSEDNNPKNAWN